MRSFVFIDISGSPFIFNIFQGGTRFPSDFFSLVQMAATFLNRTICPEFSESVWELIMSSGERAGTPVRSNR